MAEEVVKNPGSKILVVNLSTKAKYQKPDIAVEKTGKARKYVKYGEKDTYYNDLITLFTTSPTNNRCIRGISDMIYGLGLEATDSMQKPSQLFELRKVLKNKDLKKIIKDYKQLGQGTAEVIYREGRVARIAHTPTECWRAEACDEKGKIKNYFYHPDWPNIQPNDDVKELPVFGTGDPKNKNRSEIYIFRDYEPGNFYYTPVDYAGCIQYCELESEVSNYHINNIQNGLQPSLLISFNNGIPNEEMQQELERKIMNKFGGTTNAGRFILEFNDDPENGAVITPIQIPDAHAQYQFLSDEAREKIMIGHGVVSPILLGIKDNTGFGNNAEELRTASILMDNMVIRPFQHIMVEGIKEILSVNNITLDLYFKTLQPIEFTDVDKIATKIRREQETGEKLSAVQDVELCDFDDEQGDDLLDQLNGLGERINTDEWELIYTEDLTELSISAEPNRDSAQDNENYKVLYAYMPIRNSKHSRRFCKSMERFTSNNILFRREDISMMSFRGVNREHGHLGQNYSLFKYKGGVNCKHFWQKRVYRKRDLSTASPNAVPTNNPKEVPIRPYDMPRRGHHPNYRGR